MDKQLNIGMYLIDRDYRMIYLNQATKDMYPHVQLGDICYRSLACSDTPCVTCPIAKGESLFFNPIRKEWIAAQAAKMELPEYGLCQSIHFQIKQRSGSAPVVSKDEDQMRDIIGRIGGANGNECVIGCYCEPGLPIFYANESSIEMLGYQTVEEMLAACDGAAMNLIHPDDVEQVIRDTAGKFAPGKTYETVHRVPKRDGSWFWIVNKGQIIETDEGKMAIIGMCMDLTSVFDRQNSLRDQYEQLLHKDSMFDSYMNNMPGGYHRCDASENFPLSYISDSFLNVVGWSREDLQADLDNCYLNLVAPEDRDYFLSLEPELRETGMISCVYRIRRKDGSRHWVQDSTRYVDQKGSPYCQCAIADITDFVEGMNDRQRQLEEAMQRIEAVSNAKSAFLFNVSHDIRTPMNAIKGFAHIIEQNQNDPQKIGDAVRKIQHATQTLMTLMDDVLDLARIEQGKEEIDAQPVDLYEAGKSLYEMFYGDMQAAGIQFRGQGDEVHDLVLCDHLKLTRIVMNMLSNAKKFTPVGGAVQFGIQRIQMTEDTGTYRFYVKDTGIGMSQCFQARAFEQFERERTSTESRISGSGLGLSIIKKLTELMGGTVTIDSALGKGTEIAVTLTFPLAKLPDMTQKKEEIKQADLSGRRILLVEDNDFNREIARFILESMELTVEEAENGAAAIEKLLSQDPGYFDLILMDIQMPVMDGYTATQRIRCMEDLRYANTPIIAMTANAFKEDEERCLAFGMNGHLGKPIDIPKLTQTLAKIL